MALKPACDVFGTVKGVGRYELVLRAIDREDKPLPGHVPLLTRRVDLCPGGLSRLRKKIEAGITPPTERKKKAKDNADVPGQKQMALAK